MSEPNNRPDRWPAYHRTNQNWKCGRIAEGKPCSSGPTGRGDCVQKQCRPVRQLSSIRRHIQFAAFAAGVFVFMAILVSNYRQTVFAPGPLTLAHAQIMQNAKGDQRCASCHTAGQMTALSWFSSAHPDIRTGKTQSQLCMECHLRDMPDLTLAAPHDLSIEALQANGTKTSDSILTRLVHLPKVNPESHNLACSDCHREHHGKDADLQAITNTRCQSCHEKRFSSFQQGHPEFNNYPYDRERRIAFDHNSHVSKHFPQKNADFDCRMCHVNEQQKGAVGSITRSLPFEQACASCHQEPLKNALSDGIVFLQLPSLNRRAMAKANVELGAWPEDAAHAFDGKLPPLMRLLLESDVEVRAALSRFPVDRDWSHVDFTDSEVVFAAGQVAQGIRRLFQDIARNGQSAIVRRLKGVDTNAQQSDLVKLALGMPPDLFRRAYDVWFAESENAAQQPLAPTQLGPPIVSTLVDPRAEQKDLSQIEEQIGQPASEGLLGADDLLSADNDESLLGSNANDPLREDELLSAEAPDSMASDRGKETMGNLRSSQLAAGGWMIDEDRNAVVYIGTGHADPWVSRWLSFVARSKPSSSSRAVPQLPFTATMTESNLAGQGSAGATLDASRGYESHAVDSFLHPMQHGRCAECHRVDQNAMAYGQALDSTEMWKAEQRPATIRQITRFDHQPHLLLGKLADCTACHRLKKTELDAPAAVGAVGDVSGQQKTVTYVQQSEQPHVNQTQLGESESWSASIHSPWHLSEFEPMRMADCQQCHRPGAAGDNCAQCHNYHVGKAGWAWDKRPAATRIDSQEIARLLERASKR